MKKKVKTKKNNLYKYIFGMLVLILIIYMFWFFNPSYQTQVVFEGIEEVTVPLDGVVVLDEELMTGDGRGFAVMNYTDGTRVLAKTHVASLYSSGIDENTVSKIKELNEKINTLENSIKNRNEEELISNNSTGNIMKKMKKIAYYSSKGDFISTLKETDDVSAIVYGIDSTAQENQLQKLLSERLSVENSINATEMAYISKTAGILYSKTDGYETTFSREALKGITPSALETLLNTKPVDYEKTSGWYVFGKIVNNYEVSIIAACNAADVSDLKAGDSEKVLSIKSPDITNGSVECFLTSISPAEDGRVIIELKITKNIESFIKSRKMQLELVKKEYKGFRIPLEAVQRNEGEEYILVIRDGVVTKKQIEIIYRTDNFCIVNNKDATSQGVLLYDLVIIGGRNITEGTVVSVHR